MLFVPSITTLVGSVLTCAVLCVPAGAYLGSEWEKGKAAIAIQKVQARADKITEQWEIAAEAQDEVHAEQLASIARNHVADLKWLRSRPPADPKAAACTGDGVCTTGRQLSEPYAEFLIGESAAAERVAADLRICQARLGLR